MILLLIIALLSFTIHAGHSATMQEANEFEDTATLMTLFKNRRGGGSDEELRELAAHMSLEKLEIMQRACEYAVRERQKALLHGSDYEAQSLLELRALECDLRSRHYNGQQAAQQEQRKRLTNVANIGMSISGIGTAFAAAASYLCCGVINMQTVIGAGMIGAGCGCLCISAISDLAYSKQNLAPLERELANDLEKASMRVVIKETLQKAEDERLKKEWKKSVQAKKIE